MIAAEILLEPRRWAEATFGSVQLGDPRRTRRAVAIAQALASEPNASLKPDERWSSCSIA